MNAPKSSIRVLLLCSLLLLPIGTQAADPIEYEPIPLPIVTPEQKQAARERSRGKSGMVEYDLKARLERRIEVDTSRGIPQIEPGDGAWFDPELAPPLGRNFSGHTQIADPTVGIFPRHVRLAMQFERTDGQMIGRSCSGTLIGPEHVVTAGHCVYSFTPDLDGTPVFPWARSVTVQPGFNMGVGPAGTASAITFRTFPGWTEDQDYDGDVALIGLDRSVGALVGWRGVSSASGWSFFDDPTWDMWAYPGTNFDRSINLGGQNMYHQIGDYDYDDYPQIGSDRPSFRGTSGGGAIKSGLVYAVRSHLSMNATGDVDTYDTAIASDMLAAIGNQMEIDRPHPSDLVPMDVRASTDSELAGNAIDEISFLVHNRGKTTHTGGVLYRIGLGMGASSFPWDAYVHDGFDPGVIAAGESRRITLNDLVVPPGLSTGLYVLGVTLTPNDAVNWNDWTGPQDVLPFTVLCEEQGAPQLAFPENGHPCVGTDISLNWGSVPGVGIQYELSWGRTINAWEHQLTTSSTLHTLEGLDEATTYFWKVRAITACGASSAWSETFRFRTRGFVNDLELLTPSADETCIGDSVVLSWSEMEGAGSYRIRLRNQTSGVQEFFYTTQTSKALSNLDPNTRYLWSLAAIDQCANESDETSRWSFWTRATAPLDAVPVFPIDSQFTGSTTIFEIEQNYASQEVHYEVTTPGGAAVAAWVGEWRSEREGLPDGPLRWRARSLTCTASGDEFGAWSSWQDFEVDAIAPIMEYPPDPVSPPVGTWTSDPDVTVSWMPATDNCCVAGYWIAFDQAPDTIPDGSLVVDTEGSWSTEAPDGASWFHIVAVDDAGNVSAPHHLGPFMIDTAPPEAPEPVANIEPEVWTNVSALTVTWPAAPDAGVGTAGYSFAWSPLSTYVLDATIDTSEPTTTLDPAFEGARWFYVRSIDALGSASQVVKQRYFVDRTPPVNQHFNDPEPGSVYASGSSIEVDFMWQDNTTGTPNIRVEHFYSTDGGAFWYDALCVDGQGSCISTVPTWGHSNLSHGWGPYMWRAPWVPPGSQVLYRMVARDLAGNTTERVIDGPITIETTTGVDGGPAVRAFALVGNTPNPFNPRTTISYEIPKEARVELSIYDLAGRFVRSLVQDSQPGPARYEVTWDGIDAQGRHVSSGVYVYRLRAGDFEGARRMVLIK